MELNASKNNMTYQWLIGLLSVVVPILVSILFYVPQTGKLGDLDVSFLPHLNAVLNSLTAISLILGFIFIKNHRIAYHRTAMVTAFVLSSLFLVSYVVYHYQGTHTLFGDLDHDGKVSTEEGKLVTPVKYFYYALLLTHIAFAAIVVPFVLFSLYFAFTGQIVKHKKIVRYTFPIWLYVAITGVLVYFMISPYYIY
jgi:putative membrane protein